MGVDSVVAILVMWSEPFEQTFVPSYYGLHTKFEFNWPSSFRDVWKCWRTDRQSNKAGIIWAETCDFQQCGILTSVYSDEAMQPPFKLRNYKWCSVSSFTLKEYSSDKQRLWSDCAYAQAGLSFCWSHIPHCWKSHDVAHLVYYYLTHERKSSAQLCWKTEVSLPGYLQGMMI